MTTHARWPGAPRRAAPRSLRSALAVLAAVVLWAAPWGVARAGRDFNWSVSEQVIAGKEKPTFHFTPPTDLSKVVLSVRDDEGGAVRRESGPLKAGQDVAFTFPQKPGSRSYVGALEFWIGEDAYELPLKFTIVVGTPPTLDVPLDQVDEAARTLKVKSSQPAGWGEIVAIGEGGAELGRTRVDFHGERPGTLLTLTWPEVTGTLLRLDVRVTDPNGFPGAFTVWPWSYRVPHEEVVFATGQSEITPEEAEKLDRTWSEITRVIQRYGDVVDMSLFVAGYTDTVDDGASNQTLSDARARAIAVYFRQKGFSRPVYYQGFGERVLAVPTADGVDEAANRRAVYVLSAQPPRGQADFPSSAWKKVP